MNAAVLYEHCENLFVRNKAPSVRIIQAALNMRPFFWVEVLFVDLCVIQKQAAHYVGRRSLFQLRPAIQFGGGLG